MDFSRFDWRLDPDVVDSGATREALFLEHEAATAELTRLRKGLAKQEHAQQPLDLAPVQAQAARVEDLSVRCRLATENFLAAKAAAKRRVRLPLRRQLEALYVEALRVTRAHPSHRAWQEVHDFVEQIRLTFPECRGLGVTASLIGAASAIADETFHPRSPVLNEIERYVDQLKAKNAAGEVSEAL